MIVTLIRTTHLTDVFDFWIVFCFANVLFHPNILVK